MATQPHPGPFVAWFETLTNEDVPRVGGKNASLGEMVRNLATRGVRVPQGFATTANAYRAYVAANEIAGRLRTFMRSLEQGTASLHMMAGRPSAASCSSARSPSANGGVAM